VSDGETCDSFLAGRVRAFQPAEGFRAGLDTVCLAASLEAAPGERLLEAGCGAGVALLCAAERLPGALLAGLERCRSALALAERNIVLNGLAGRVTANEGDVAEKTREIENQFDQAFANPPFFKPDTTRPPLEAKRAAFIADDSLKVWVRFLFHCVRRGGRVTLIHRAACLAEVLALVETRGGEVEVLPLRPYPYSPAHRVLVRARKGLRPGPLRLHQGLVLHAHQGGPLTEEAHMTFTGGPLNWR
jgi:tRNA1(Val) A37 N6-methylase TrmN6